MMRKILKSNLFVFRISILIIFVSCQSDNCFKGAGSEGYIHIETGYFKDITFNGMFDVILVQDSMCYLDVNGGKNMIPYVNAQNTDSSLWVENSNGCLFLKDYEKIKVFVHFKDIEQAEFKVPCNIRSEIPLTDDFTIVVSADLAEINIELNNNHFAFYDFHTSAGDYTFRGKSSICYLAGYYTSRINASELKVENMYIESHSIVDFYVNSEKSLHVKIFDRGNVYFYGNPEVVIDTLAGKGNVFKAN
jgi:hypothetical protein